MNMIQLICLFSTEDVLDNTICMITKTYDIIYRKIFVLSLEENKELVCTFNVCKGTINKQLPGAMIVHRKKETNTLYTINSLNMLIKKNNDGMCNPNYSVNWQLYPNSLLLTYGEELRIIKTKLFQIINL